MDTEFSNGQTEENTKGIGQMEKWTEMEHILMPKELEKKEDGVQA